MKNLSVFCVSCVHFFATSESFHILDMHISVYEFPFLFVVYFRLYLLKIIYNKLIYINNICFPFTFVTSNFSRLPFVIQHFHAYLTTDPF